ncbi:suppressor of fused domain protein [Usitatibacter palustris]|uniref:Suppressor of fused-like domain-containing protein n=1 Tax=Usitatibacter palustris TaxID=2732487 RepID=A0A6M4H2K6_9PROT|nr:suppressor of fused domain protein [Usitatibacter palustris]QJR13555.1 hypothetical protein DSM104440_00339 [Usitatibacter palustris]
MTAGTDPLEAVWEHREDVVYPGLFGSKSRGIFVLEAETFAKVIGEETIDPRWLFHGVFEFEPTEERPTWLYVTSGTSTPWGQEPESYAEAEYSGIGTELVFESTEQGDWAIVLLQRMLAFNILLSYRRFGDANPLDYWQRIPYRGPITLERPSLLQHLVVGLPTHFPSSFQLQSGRVDLLQVVGITEAEQEFAKEHGSDKLIEILAEADAYPVTSPSRASII